MRQFSRLTPLGVNFDIDPIDLPDTAWTESGNMVAQPGRMQRAQGYQEIWAAPLFAPQFLLYSPQLSQHYWLYGGALNLGTVDQAGTHADITPASLTGAVPKNGWSGGNLNGLAVVNSLENVPYYWFEGQATALELPGMRTNTRYRVMRPFKYHLIGLGVTDDSGTFWDSVHWSNASDPGQIPDTWIPAADNEAGDNILADENGEIIDGLALRDAFYIYKQDTVYEMSYIGGNEIFRFRKVFGTTGVLARNCVVRVKGTHIVLGNGDIYQHDGQNLRSIVDGKVRDTFFATIDDDNYESSFAVYLEQREEVWFCVPSAGQTRPNLALTYNVTTGEFGYRTIPDADFAATGIVAPIPGAALEQWDDDSGEWNQDSSPWLDQGLDATEDGVLIADATGTRLMHADIGTTHDGVAYRASVGRLGLGLGNPNSKAIRRMWPRINAPAGTAFTLELFNQRSPMEAQELLATVPFTPDPLGVAVNVNARYLGFRIYSDEAVDWDIAGVDIEWMPRGRF